MADFASHSAQPTPDQQWFGPSTFTAAATAMSVNIVPVLVIPYLWVLYLVVIPVEILTGGLLLLRPGAGRQAGAGILTGVLASAAATGLGLLIFNA
ncbi:hypothetical protein F5X71_24905 [Nocardia brasiliensis]|uniref:Uncharacterized protein n=1 Tax=Nocardia brasiliensis TaxID=37326 RepID=A0A6G9XW32_NOCBR|nr:hypothetical protein [Nocardia brasiliensis]QIS05125.1 hypothetical protein F5X71_24905 [Nocardia brasiliensis]